VFQLNWRDTPIRHADRTNKLVVRKVEGDLDRGWLFWKVKSLSYYLVATHHIQWVPLQG